MSERNTKRLSTLCRCRHNGDYADLPIMPALVRSVLVRRVVRADLVGIIQAARDCSLPALVDERPQTVCHRERVIVPQTTVRTPIYVRHSDVPSGSSTDAGCRKQPVAGPLLVIRPAPGLP